MAEVCAILLVLALVILAAKTVKTKSRVVLSPSSDIDAYVVDLKHSSDPWPVNRPIVLICRISL